jgi:hypothetical protein
LDAAAQALLERAMQQLRSRQWDPATATLQRLLDRIPEQPAALQLLGVAAFESGRGGEAVQAVADGTVHAVAFWVDLHLDDAITLSTAPGGDSTHWRQAIAFLDQDRPVRRDEYLHLTVGHTDSHFFFRWLES